MNWLKIGKLGLTFVTSTGVGLVIKNAVLATTPKNLGPINRALVGFGGFVISSMIADKACEYVNQQVDDLIESIFPPENPVVITPLETPEESSHSNNGNKKGE